MVGKHPFCRPAVKTTACRRAGRNLQWETKATAPWEAEDKRVIFSDQVSTPLSPGKLNHPLLLSPPLDSYNLKWESEKAGRFIGQATVLAVGGLKSALKRKLKPH